MFVDVRRCSQYSPGTVSRFRGVGLRLRTPPLYPIMTCSGEVDPGHLFIVAVAYKDLWGHPVTSTCRVKVSNIQSHSKYHSKSFDMKETVPAKISSKHCVKHRNIVRNILRLLHGFACPFLTSFLSKNWSSGYQQLGSFVPSLSLEPIDEVCSCSRKVWKSRGKVAEKYQSESGNDFEHVLNMLNKYPKLKGQHHDVECAPAKACYDILWVNWLDVTPVHVAGTSQAEGIDAAMFTRRRRLETLPQLST